MFVKLTKWDEGFFSFTTFEINDQNDVFNWDFETKIFWQFLYLKISKNIDLNAKDISGLTLFTNACINGHKWIVKSLKH